MRTKSIKWDTDGDREVFESLPQEVELPDRFNRENYMDEHGEVDETSWCEDIGDYLSDTYEFCHSGFVMEMDTVSGDNKINKDTEKMLYNAIIGWFDDTTDKNKYIDSDDFVSKVCQAIGLSKTEYYRIMHLSCCIEKSGDKGKQPECYHDTYPED